MDFLKFLNYHGFLLANLDLIRKMASDLKEAYGGDSPMASAASINAASIEGIGKNHPELLAACNELDGPSIARNISVGSFASLIQFITANLDLFLLILERFAPQPADPVAAPGGDADNGGSPGTDDNPSTAA